ncbi:A24 family peptidase [Rosenbergiella epipactidis]|uniref:A24 family peptidase n=1 Tax=Rosenbergiella epipactidis TaxID=1544694 RepID=UPI0034DE77B3
MFFLIVVLFIRICYTDIRFRIIENKCIIAILIINVLSFLMGKETPYFYSAIIIFSVGVICILSNCVGAGDVKLLTVLGMVFPPGELPDFIFLVTVSGLPLIFIVYLLHRFSKRKFSKTLPYGVAIISGYLLKILI